MSSTLILLVTTAAFQAQRAQPPALEPVDQGVADVHPLATSLRSMLIDLRTPTGFDRVFKLDQKSSRFFRSSGALHAIFPHSTYAFDEQAQLIPTIPAGTRYVLGDAGLAAARAEAEKYARNSGIDSPAQARAVKREIKPLARPLEGLSDREGGRPIDARVTPGRADASGRVVQVIDEEPRRSAIRDDATGAARVVEPIEGESEPRLAEFGSPPAIVADAEYRRRRLHELLRAAVQAARGPSDSSSK